MEKLKYALIGCGRISPTHFAAAMRNIGALDIVAVSDIVPDHMEGLLSKFEGTGGIRRYTDYKEMLEKEKPQLVAVATDSGSHARVALDCIHAGCNVIVEKPISLSLADADRIIQAAEEKGVKLCANHQNRFNKAIVKLREALDEGRFGRLFHAQASVRWSRGPEYYKQDAWRGTWAGDGGTLMNQCIHNIDLLRWMMGNEIKEVFAYTDRLDHPYIEAEDLGLALVRFANGSYGIVEGTSNVFQEDFEETFTVFGEKGLVKVGGLAVNQIEDWKFCDGKDKPETLKKDFSDMPNTVYGFGHAALYSDMIDAVQNDRKPYVDGEDGRRALELVLAIYKSAAEGRPVKLPLGDCSTLDFAGRFDRR